MSFIESSEDVMVVLEEMIAHTFDVVLRDGSGYLDCLTVDLSKPKLPFPRISFENCIHMLAESGLNVQGDLDTEAEKKLGELMKENHGTDWYFITDFPTELKKETFYAMRDIKNPDLTRYFDLDYKGEEMVSGGQREHRYEVLVSQMQDIGANTDEFEFYLKAFRFGMPPHGGFGLGIERVLHMMLSLPNIRECVLFPRDMYRVVP
jgi:aspartyl-tRNA synthetase